MKSASQQISSMLCLLALVPLQLVMLPSQANPAYTKISGALADEQWAYSPRVDWKTVPTFFFATTNLSSDGAIDAQSMNFLQNFSLIIMPKIQGPNTRNLTDPARPTPGCCSRMTGSSRRCRRALRRRSALGSRFTARSRRCPPPAPRATTWRRGRRRSTRCRGCSAPT